MNDPIGSAGRGASKVITKVFIVALVFIVAGYYFKDDLFPNPAVNPDAHYSHCTKIAENCTDVATCPMNVYCGDGIFSDCRIYDCGSDYGIATTDQSGQISFREENKPNEDITQSVRNACSGTMETLSSKCIEGKTEIELKLDTAGECQIESFAVIFKDTGITDSTFVSKGNGIYALEAQNCGTIDQIIPAATGGVGLEMEQAGA
jgi:hypothetical protein